MRLVNSQKQVSCVKLTLHSSANQGQEVVYVSVETGFEPNAYPIMPHAPTSESLLMASLLVTHSLAVGKSITNLCVGLPSWFFGLVGIREPTS
jgi:hypothetical protein